MRWSRKIHRDPHLGDMRTLRKFAWFPTAVHSSWVWLEYYTTTQIYREAEYTSIFDAYVSETRLEWVEFDRGLT